MQYDESEFNIALQKKRFFDCSSNLCEAKYATEKQKENCRRCLELSGIGLDCRYHVEQPAG